MSAVDAELTFKRLAMPRSMRTAVSLPGSARTVTDAKRLGVVLTDVEKEGYAWIDGELDPAICGIAVPLRDPAGAVVAAISVNMISGTISEAGAKKKFLIPLKKTAQDIRSQMLSSR